MIKSQVIALVYRQESGRGRWSALSSPLSKRNGLAVAAFAARLFDASSGQRCFSAISKA